MMTNKTPHFSADDAVKSAKHTISVESAGLEAIKKALEDGLSKPFAEAVKSILQSKGRVIVTGLGKSGHIGTKIAATLASTGGILNHAARFRIPLIALTSGAHSALGQAADILLLLPKVEEACPHGLAPTTSTTMQLAMGDALAVALLEMRGFTASDFKIFHPGGSLGANLKFIRDIMHRGDRIPIVKSGTPMKDAMQVLIEKHFGCVAVVDSDGNLEGIVTDGDLARNINRDLSKLTVNDVMTKDPKTVTPDMMVGAATALINDHKIGALLVVENKKPVGLVHFHDLLRIGAI